jgi:DNA-directed RNA polymerase specialized sigma24 family protein
MSARTPPALRGDEAALYARHAGRLRRIVARRLVRPGAPVEDACAYAWETLLTHQPDRERVFGCLCTTATREAWRLARRERREQAIDGYPPEVATAIVGPARVNTELAVDARAALCALAALPPRQR